MTEDQIRHLEESVPPEEMDEFLAGRSVREYAEEYSYIPSLYWDVCSDLGVTPIEPLPAEFFA